MSKQNRVPKRGKNRKLKFDSDSKKIIKVASQLAKGFGNKKAARLLDAQKELKKVENKVKKIGGEVEFNKVSLPSLKKMSLREINRYTRELENVLVNPKIRNKNGLIIPLSTIEQRLKAEANVNRIKTREYNRRLKLPLMEGGKQEKLGEEKLSVDFLRYMKHGAEGTGLFKFKFNLDRYKTMEDYYEDHIEFMEKTKGGYMKKRDKTTIEGWLKALDQQGFTGFEEGRKLKDYVETLNPTKAVDIISSNLDAGFEFLYGKSEIKGRLETLIEVFERNK